MQAGNRCKTESVRSSLSGVFALDLCISKMHREWCSTIKCSDSLTSYLLEDLSTFTSCRDEQSGLLPNQYTGTYRVSVTTPEQMVDVILAIRTNIELAVVSSMCLCTFTASETRAKLSVCSFNLRVPYFDRAFPSSDVTDWLLEECE